MRDGARGPLQGGSVGLANSVQSSPVVHGIPAKKCDSHCDLGPPECESHAAIL